VILATQNAKGNRITNAVIDSQIDEEFIHCIIRPSIIPIFIFPSKFMAKVFGVKPRYRKRFKKVEYIVDI
jgi:hypothetical protein